ncbi:hypothetical protein GCM10007972_00410 [Iodidimonas muriae]|uniref:DUF1499 domain-containing protein n=1 Tax=Iodidimonas muriae TaxID=261467 RepID=A0ABQ2L824_9PROT|nr:DUF1499 domain-containing protein [Iodidimonas muriae]GER06302.1 hypothetical protein JCM17843_06120 [Kordiimonadales bacterium JCM 17843]GGO04219.1 hypothetical protein GCM10007972_00410 [Iodidimonas muriae]
MTPDKPSRFWGIASTSALLLAFFALLLMLVPGPLVKADALPFRTAFDVMRRAFYLAAGLGVVSFIALLIATSRANGRTVIRLSGALVLCLIVVSALYMMRRDAASHVPIHDVTTDLIDPPRFTVITPRIENPLIVPDRGRKDLAAVPPDVRWRIYHKEAYGTLAPLFLDSSVEDTMARARQAARKMGWEIAHFSVADGRLEATDTTSWFGFKDDIVVRIRMEKGQSRVDVRSVSRIGISDLGANAKRVRHFLETLSQQGQDS